MTDLYWTLGIRMGASPAEIKAAYRRAALKYHPDRGGSETKMKEVNAAYATLSNPERRTKYDRELAQLWAIVEKWSRNAPPQPGKPSSPPQHQATPTPHQRSTNRLHKRPAPWRYWTVRCVLALIIALYGGLLYGAVQEGPWGLVTLILISEGYAVGAMWIYNAVHDVFLG